uniref:Uncharacterized protein n=1 Tax=Aegilops tauschii TaxID=37682 RepID=N1R4F3_AEGTA
MSVTDCAEFEASLRDGHDFEDDKEQPSCPRLSYRASEDYAGSRSSDRLQQ